MAPFTLRRAQPLLLHALVWGLLILLLALQPADRVTGPAYLLLQSLLLALLGLVFYLNVKLAVPRLLYRRHVLGYGAFLVGAVVGVLAAHRLLEGALATTPGPRALLPPPLPPAAAPAGTGPAGLSPAGPHRGVPPRRGGAPRFGLFNPAVFVVTLLTLGLGTSVAAVQRGQREAQRRQELEQEKLSTELSWLKAQINPHFFFNTLNNIYALTLIDGDKAREALHRLSRMMRYVLYETQAGTAPLSQELLFVRDYIDLMQLRLTDNVQVEYHTPEPLHDAPIAPLILLTFVENAFKHGVSTVEPSRIHISIRHPTPHTLAVDVRNTLFPARPAALDENHGIGLVNTRRRLDLLYPGRYTLTAAEYPLTAEYHVHLTLTLLP